MHWETHNHFPTRSLEVKKIFTCCCSTPCIGHPEGGVGASTCLLCIGHSAGGWAEMSMEEWSDGSSEMPWVGPVPVPVLVMTLAVFWAAEMVLPIAD